MEIRISKTAAQDMGDAYFAKGAHDEVVVSAYGNATIMLKWSEEKMPPFATVHLDRATVWEIVTGMIRRNCGKVLRAAMKEFMGKEDD